MHAASLPQMLLKKKNPMNMRHTMKKLLIAVLTVAMLLSACWVPAAAENPPAEESAEETPAATPAPSEGTVTGSGTKTDQASAGGATVTVTKGSNEASVHNEETIIIRGDGSVVSTNGSVYIYDYSDDGSSYPSYGGYSGFIYNRSYGSASVRQSTQVATGRASSREETVDHTKAEVDTTDHSAFITGTEGKINPEQTVSRGEAAYIFYNILKDKEYETTETYSDVALGSKYYVRISCLSYKGVITGFEDGTFRPNRKLTRAELCQMVSRFFPQKATQLNFTDVEESYWAYDAISSCAAYGFICNEEGRFYPNIPVTREELVAIMNLMTGRDPDQAYIDANADTLISFTDVNASNPYYYEIMEAANGHLFDRDTSGSEYWMSLQ